MSIYRYHTITCAPSYQQFNSLMTFHKECWYNSKNIKWRISLFFQYIQHQYLSKSPPLFSHILVLSEGNTKTHTCSPTQESIKIYVCLLACSGKQWLWGLASDIHSCTNNPQLTRDMNLIKISVWHQAKLHWSLMKGLLQQSCYGPTGHDQIIQNVCMKAENKL